MKLQMPSDYWSTLEKLERIDCKDGMGILCLEKVGTSEIKQLKG